MVALDLRGQKLWKNMCQSNLLEKNSDNIVGDIVQKYKFSGEHKHLMAKFVLHTDF